MDLKTDKTNESKKNKPIELTRKSKKIKKSYNLLDFVVVKERNKKTKQIKQVKVSKQIQKRGKLRKKKLTTLKKRILKERQEKQLLLSQADALSDRLQNVSLDEPQKCVEIPDETVRMLKVLNATADDLALMTTGSESLPANTPQVQHSRNFREYCNHFITTEIKNLTEKILQDLLKFQDNKFSQNPVKAKANKRYVVGFKEVKKFLIVKRLKLIIIAPDIARSSELDSLVDEIKAIANQHNIPYVFSIKRRHIGYVLLKKVPVSVVGIFDYQGTTENVNELLKYVQEEKISYRTKTKSS